MDENDEIGRCPMMEMMKMKKMMENPRNLKMNDEFSRKVFCYIFPRKGMRK